jgi:hypothetical protein
VVSAVADRAVLTGDIVRSGRLGPGELEAAMTALRAGAEAAGAWTGEAPRFTRFRGDGWQCLAPSPRLALRAALLAGAFLRREGRHMATRVAVGIGSADVPSAGDLSSAAGPAFERAGQALDTMRRSARLAIAWEAPPPGAGAVVAIVGLVDELARRWTPAQARVLVRALEPEGPTQQELAASLGMAQQTVAGHLQAAGAPAIEAALAQLEAA